MHGNALLYGLDFAFAAVGAAIGAWKGKLVLGLFAGAMLGPIGWLLMAIYPNQRRRLRLAAQTQPGGAESNANLADRPIGLADDAVGS